MMELTLKSHRFRMEREADWKRLERLLDRYERGSRSSLTDDEVIAIPVLYRATLSSLSMARAISLDRSMIDYLESLATRAYFCVYGARATIGERVANFFLIEWPNAARSLWRETIVAGAFTSLGTVAAFLLTLQSSDWFNAFVPAGLAAGRGPAASTKDLHDTLVGHTHAADGLTVLSTFLFAHNAQIAILAFALGFACCLPTAFLMIYNGLMLGAFVALFLKHGLGLDFGGWVLIHGVTELFAVTLSGAAGFRIGWALAFPGTRDRLDALAEAGREAAIVMVGAILMLAVAGLLEGFARQLIVDTPARYAVAVLSAGLWGAYFYAGGTRR
jgi:uncharacterized membrane protein SpoIIM required for sporulation